jgi:hypothetical protein
VVLLAAVFGTRKAYEWAIDVLPLARNAEHLMSEPKEEIIERDDTHDAEYREEATREKRRIQDIRENGTLAVLEYEGALE